MEKNKISINNMPMLKNLESKFDLVFDYEINTTETDDNMDCKMYYYDEILMEKSICFYINRNR